jgi:hypothetical protein
MWTRDERHFLRKLNSPEKIQATIDGLIYNCVEDAASPRYIMMTGDGHCFEGGLLAAAALEFHGYPPLMVDLQAEDDDHHVLTVFKTKYGWGSISKSNTALLRGRDPVYRSVRELVMSYFDFYFNLRGEKSLYAYTDPINLNRFNSWNWRTSDENLKEMGIAFNDLNHYEIVQKGILKNLPKASQNLKNSCFLGSDLSGLYQG